MTIPYWLTEKYEAEPFNRALELETVAEAEERARQGWPWPVSGDDTKRADG